MPWAYPGLGLPVDLDGFYPCLELGQLPVGWHGGHWQSYVAQHGSENDLLNGIYVYMRSLLFMSRSTREVSEKCVYRVRTCIAVVEFYNRHHPPQAMRNIESYLEAIRIPGSPVSGARHSFSIFFYVLPQNNQLRVVLNDVSVQHYSEN